LIAVDSSDTKTYFFRCHHDYFTNRDLTCDSDSKSEVALTADDVIASQSRSLDYATFFFTTQPTASASRFYLDNGSSLVNTDIQNSLDATN